MAPPANERDAGLLYRTHQNGTATQSQKRELRRLFRLVSIPELLERPDPTWLIAGVLQAGTNSVLAAAHASFKSFIALYMALSVALGRDWCGRKVQQGHVIYICAEGAEGMKARVRAWCFDRGEDWPKLFHFIEEPVQVHDTRERVGFLASLGGIKPALIVLDTLSLCALGLDENSTKDMNAWMASVKLIQDATGAHVLLVHHHSKAGGTRGASAIPAATQTEIEAKRERETVTLTCLKQKDGPEFPKLTFSAREVEYDTFHRKSSLVLDYAGVASDAVVMNKQVMRVYELLAGHFSPSGATKSEIWEVASEKGIPKTTFYRALKELAELRKIDDGEGKRGAKIRIIASEDEENEIVP